MPVITKAECWPSEITLNEPFVVDISIRAVAPGAISFHFEIDDELPYFILLQSEPAKSIVCRRSFDMPAEYKVRFVLQLGSRPPADAIPAMKVTASGLDGTSNTVQLALNVL